MNRDMDAIRKILFAVKEANQAVSKVDGVEDDVFKFNAMLLIEAGLVLGASQPSGRSSSPVPAATLIRRLTWEGYDFVDSIEDDDIWQKAKQKVLNPAGSWTFSILSEYIKYEIKTKLGMNNPA